MVQTVSIADRPQEVEEISVAVQRLFMGCTGVPLGMTAEHFKGCLREATRGKDLDREHGDKLVSITRLVFRYGHIP